MKIKVLPVIFSLLIFSFLPSYANENSFNLAGIIENIINFQNQEEIDPSIKNSAKETFLSATTKFLQGNVIVAYDEYKNTIDNLDKNFALFMFAQRLYANGLFSLGDEACLKLSDKNKFNEQIKTLKEAYSPSYKLTKDEEVYLARAYTQMHFNNSPEEVAFNLVKKTNLLENSDYANFILAKSLFECRQFAQAHIYIDKAIEKNNLNSNYKIFKINVLISENKNKEALKYIELLEKENKISPYFYQPALVLKNRALLNLAKNDSDKKFYQIYSYYLAGDYYKAIKETQNILNFNKNNPKILTLQGMCHLALNELEPAFENFKASYKMDKNFSYTLMGLADFHFINKEYDEAISSYKKLLKTELKDEAYLKIDLCYNVQETLDKKYSKNKQKLDEIEKNLYREYYLIANNLLLDNETFKKRYIAKAIYLNPVSLQTWNFVLKNDYNNEEFKRLDLSLFALSFLDKPNAEFYYYNAVLLDRSNLKKEAFYELKNALTLNPDFKPAADFMNKLQNELI